tara:strand:+ start:44 stop:1147 length:1104 start_codon:yes stop_codon:yes gene_type:complete
MILNGIICFGITLVMLPLIIRLSKKNNWVDKPDGRKNHIGEIPNLGGVAILIAISLSCSNYFMHHYFFYASILLLFLVGLIDDKLDLSAKIKFGIQFLSATCIVYGEGLFIHPESEILLGLEIPIFILEIASLVLMVGVINSVNLLDGIDGLVGGMLLISFLVLTSLFIYLGQGDVAVLCICLTFSCLAYLKYNYAPAKIFLGDNGSLVLGGILGYLILNIFSTHSSDSSVSHLIGFSILFIPCYDMLRLFITRILQKKSPFKADTNHVHHLLLKSGFNVRKTTLILWGIHALVLLFCVVLLRIDDNKSMIYIKVPIAAIYLYEVISLRNYIKLKSEKRVAVKELKDLSNENAHAFNQLTKKKYHEN